MTVPATSNPTARFAMLSRTFEDVTFGLMVDFYIPGDLYFSPSDETASQVVSSVSVAF